MTDQMPEYDVVIIGGGPAGATAGLQLARAGKRVAIVEKATFPRFQIGESFLPANFQIMKDLGLTQGVKQLPHMPKYGAEFLFGDATESSVFQFDTNLVGEGNETLNIARADFDRFMLDMAVEAGAEVHAPAKINQIESLADGHVVVSTAERRFTARYLFDASGQATLIGRHLGIRRAMKHPHLQKIAYFEHFQNVARLDGDNQGHPTVVMCDEGWFWIIPLNKQTTSVGLVLDRDIARQAEVPADEMLAWGIERCPAIRQRVANASRPDKNRVRSDFSYTCNPVAGEGYFLIGDAALFIDPVFSSGVCLGMVHAMEASKQVLAVLDGHQSPRAARGKYTRYTNRGSTVFMKIVCHFYNHNFRELFLSGEGPLRVHRAVMAVLAGYVFPRMKFSVAWRFKLFEFFVFVQHYKAIALRRKRFSLLKQPSGGAPQT